MLVLGYVSMAASLSTDLYLPSFPAIATAFGVGQSVVQLTLTAFLVGAAAGQLVIGALSDALGRRKTLLVALALFAACAIAAASSVSIEMLLLTRAVQGFAGSAGAVLARAVIADMATPAETARAFGTLFVLISLGPAIANPLGGWLTEIGSWRAPLLALSLIAVSMCVVAVLQVPESLPPERRHPFHFGSLVTNLWRLATTRAVMGFVLAFGCGYAGMMVYISSSSFIGQEIFGLSPLEYSLTFALGSVSFMGGAAMSSRLVARAGAVRALRVGQWLQMVSATVGLILAMAGGLLLAPYLAVVACFCAGTGMIMSTASALAIAQAVGAAGAGSALVGCSQFILGAIGTPLGGLFGVETAVPALVSMAVFSVLSFVAASVSRGHSR